MTSTEEIGSNTKTEDSNWMFVENPQDKEDITEATSKEQDGESTQTNFDPLLSPISLDLRAICSQLLSKYRETIKDTSKWNLSLRSFLL